MAHNRLMRVSVAFVATAALGGSGAAVAGAATAARVTICYNRTNGVVHYSSSGQCAATQTAVVIGRGAIGIRGVAGLRGAHGLMGPQGPIGAAGAAGTTGLNGPQGLQGAQGLQGPQGVQGITGGSGGLGGSGATGTTGGTGLSGPSGGTGLSGPSGGTGLSGPSGGTGLSGGTGPQGDPGVNVVHTVTSALDTNPGGDTLDVPCPAGSVVTGGGFSAASAVVTISKPDSAKTGWTVTYSGGGSSMTVYAMCVVGSVG